MDPTRRWVPLVAALGALALASGCGGGGSAVVAGGTAVTATTAASTSALPAGPAAAAPAGPPDRSASILPSVPLTDVRSGATVDLASLVPAPRPLLLWFWAPH